MVEQLPELSLPSGGLVILMPISTSQGGASSALLSFLDSAYAKTRVRGVIFFEPGSLLGPVREKGYEVVQADISRMRHPLGLAQGILTVTAFSRRVGAAAVLSWMTRAALVGALSSRLARCSHFVFQHGKDERALLDRVAYRLPHTAVLACGSGPANSLRGRGHQRPVHVIQPALRKDQLLRELPGRYEARQRLNLPAGRPIVGCVARLEPWKGVHHLLNAAQKILAREPEILFVVVGAAHPGSEEYEEYLHTHARRLGLAEVVKFVGAQPDGLLWIRSFDMLLHLSQDEPFGLVLIEAVLAGVPLVASDSGGPTEIFSSPIDALLVEPDDSAALADAVVATLQNPEITAARVARAKLLIERYTPDAFGRRVADAIRPYGG